MAKATTVAGALGTLGLSSQLFRCPPSTSHRPQPSLSVLGSHDSLAVTGHSVSSLPTSSAKSPAPLPFWQELILPVGFSLTSEKLGKKESKSYLKLKPKSLTFSSERVLPQGLEFCANFRQEKPVQEQRPGLWPPWLVAGGWPLSL